MDETIKILTPKHYVKKDEKKVKNSYFYEVFKEKDEQIKKLSNKHPLFNLFYNWVIFILLVILIFAVIVCCIQANTNKKVNLLVATAMADYQAQQQAIADQEAEAIRLEQQTEEYITSQMAESLARVFVGISKFEDKYGYTERDLLTLARCIFNRVENATYSNDFFEVINQENQWVGYSENNSIIDKYYQIALKAVQEWRSETTKPCSNDYLWAEFTPGGIYLKNDFKADGYSIRWRYGNI